MRAYRVRVRSQVARMLVAGKVASLEWSLDGFMRSKTHSEGFRRQGETGWLFVALAGDGDCL